MKLKDLIPETELDLEISGITTDSREVKPGDLFIVCKGGSFDGNDFSHDAEKRGAVAVLSDRKNAALSISQIFTSTIDLPTLANRYYGFPSRKLFTVGITGTNGKTTTSYLIHHLLGGGLINTVETQIGNQSIPSKLTTPDLLTNQRYLHEMATCGCKNAIIEVSSHGLEQGRVEGIDFDVALFTNLSHEHLDYHGTMQSYAKAKAKLFSGLRRDALAIINQEDSWAEVMKKNCPARVCLYGREAQNIQLSPEKTSFTVQNQLFEIPLIGKHNISNTLGAIAVARRCGMTLPDIAERLREFRSVPGRLERIENDRGIHFFVDFAHTPEALKVVLCLLTQIKTGRLITLFGCGGDRDFEKRPMMAQIVERYSDFAIVTNDNPRNEDPELIAEQITEGFTQKEKFKVILDRKQAIETSIRQAERGDVILLAGKGHELCQIFKNKQTHFDDREVARDSFLSKN